MHRDTEDKMEDKTATVRQQLEKNCSRFAFIEKSFMSGDLGPQHHTGKT